MFAVKKISDAVRFTLAAFLAPAVPAVFVLIWGFLTDPDWAWWGFWLFVVPSYMSMLFVGAPLLWLFRRKGWSLNAWRCIAAGTLSGVVFVLPIQAVDLVSGANAVSVKFGWLIFLTGVSALTGALAGLVFRVIAGSSISAVR